MGIVDFILNLAGLLLWIKWRSLPFDPFNRRTPATLVGTLRRAAPSRFRRWHLLAVIGALLLLRAIFYWQIGAAMQWSGKLNLAAIALSFPIPTGSFSSLERTILFSILSFALMLGIFYLWLLLFSLLAGKAADAEPAHRPVRVQLGGIDRWPRGMKLFLPLLAGSLLWWLTSWPLSWLQIIPRPISEIRRAAESLVVGLGSYLAWEYAAAGLLVLHLLNTYVYFGKHPLWNYVATMAQTLLQPLEKIPLRAGKVDFAPVVGIALVFLIGELAERGLAALYERLLL